MNKKIILVHGSYFTNNFGDTLLIKLICDYLSENTDLQIKFAVEGNHLEQSYLGYDVIKKTEYHQVKKIIYTGGGYFGEPNVGFVEKLKWSKRNYKRHLQWKKKFKVPTAYIGIGTGPLSIYPFKKLVKNELINSDLLIVRDEESLQFCKNLGATHAELGVDYAFSLYENKKIEKERIVLIHSNKKITKYDKLAINQLRYMYPEYKFILINDISKSCQKRDILYKEYKDFIDDYFPYKNLNQLLSLIKKSEIILTSKLHVGIVGLSFNCKMISIPYHQKTIRLYKQFEIDDYCVPKYDFSENKLIKSINKLENFNPDYNIIESSINKINKKMFDFLNS